MVHINTSGTRTTGTMKHTIKIADVIESKIEVELDFPLYLIRRAGEDITASRYESPERKVFIGMSRDRLLDGLKYEVGTLEVPGELDRIENLIERAAGSKEARRVFGYLLRDIKSAVACIEP